MIGCCTFYCKSNSERARISCILTAFNLVLLTLNIVFTAVKTEKREDPSKINRSVIALGIGNF